jgi:DNA-binding MarR family transcriptional regulator
MNERTDAAALASVGELRSVIHKLNRRLREQAMEGSISSSQRSVLSHLLREGPLTLSALARAEGMRPQSMAPIIAALEQSGFLVGSPHPTDRRQTLLTLTPVAHDFADANRAAKDDWLYGSIREHLTRSEQDTLARAIPLLQRLVEP